MSAIADGIFSPKRLVVLGAGYIGGFVARQGLARGLAVTALTRNAAAAEALRAAGAEVVIADLADEDWHGRIAGGAEYVLDAVSAGGGGIEGYRRSYVEGMRSLVRWAETRGTAGTIVYTSSTSVYPQGGGATVDEAAPTDGAGERGAVLREAEWILLESGGAARRTFVLRLAGIYGPGRHHVLDQVRAGEVAGQGEHRLNVAHRDDIAAAIWVAFDAPEEVAGGVFNVADDAPTPKAEVTAWLAARLGVAAPRFTGEPYAGRRAVTPDRTIANARLKSALGWRPRFADFRAGYENVLAAEAESGFTGNSQR